MRFQSIDRRALLCGVLLVVGQGCLTHAAELENTVQHGSTVLHLQRATGRSMGPSRLTARLHRVPEGLTLLGASLSSDDILPCALGTPAVRFGRDGATSAEQPLVAGERLALQFGSNVLSMLGHRSRLDLRVETGEGHERCLRFPVVDGDSELDIETVQRFTVGFELTVEGLTAPLGSVTQVLSLPVVVGTWVGPLHLHVAAGIAGAGCRDTRCPVSDEDKHVDHSNGFTTFAGMDTTFWEYAMLSLGASLRYRVTYLTADTFVGEDSERFWANGPVVAPSIRLVDEVLPNGTGGGARAAMIAVEVPVGYYDAGDFGRALSVGFNLRFLFTVL